MRRTLLLVIAVIVAACGAEPGASPPPSSPGAVDADGDWRLVGGTSDGVALPMVPGADITMTVDGSRISGRSGCNQYGGEIVVADGRVRFGSLFMTEMACDEPIMASEAAYHAALGKVRAASLDSDTLTLSGPGVELVFVTFSQAAMVRSGPGDPG
jgi:heat shock protein HslJ